jgi:hypothetical protein
MNTNHKEGSLKLVTQQTTNNATSWVGHSKDHKEISSGQTFIANAEGDLETIEVFSNIVSQPGKVKLTIHSFDPNFKTWGATLGTSNIALEKSDTGKWLSFKIPALHLDKGKVYGFKLESHDCYMGVGEAAGSSKNPPFVDGQEWRFLNNNSAGDSFSYFSLVFKIGLTA